MGKEEEREREGGCKEWKRWVRKRGGGRYKGGKIRKRYGEIWVGKRIQSWIRIRGMWWIRNSG